MLEDVTEVGLVEALSSCLLLGHVLQQRVEDLQPCVGNVPHGVFEGPDDGVQHQLELGRRDGQEGRKTVGVYSLEQVEKVGPVFWILFKVLKQTKCKKHTSTFYLKGFWSKSHKPFTCYQSSATLKTIWAGFPALFTSAEGGKTLSQVHKLAPGLVGVWHTQARQSPFVCIDCLLRPSGPKVSTSTKEIVALVT